jgi:hypothetical protein
MSESEIRRLLENFKTGKVETERVIAEIRDLPYKDLSEAKIDTHRSIRRGFPEAILAKGKTLEQIEKIVKDYPQDENVIITKAGEDVYRVVKAIDDKAEYKKEAGMVIINRKIEEKIGKVLIISAGTADIPIAEEAAVTAELMGSDVDRLYDVGVAGVHRLFDKIERLREARVLVVVAGMEGALPSVVGGLLSAPVIGVPTSVGYGSSFSGLSALLGMLNSCVPGVLVVNIDNGFGAGYAASIINRMVER